MEAVPVSDAPALILPEKTRSIGNDLRRILGADKVKDDFPTITAYSVDASIYKVVPKAVVTAETEEDIAGRSPTRGPRACPSPRARRARTSPARRSARASSLTVAG